MFIHTCLLVCQDHRSAVLILLVIIMKKMIWSMTMTMITLIRVMMRRIMIIMVSIPIGHIYLLRHLQLFVETFTIIFWDNRNSSFENFWDILNSQADNSRRMEKWKFLSIFVKVKVALSVFHQQLQVKELKKISEAEKFRFANKQSWKVEFLMGCQLSTRQIPSDLCLHSSGKTWPSQKEFLSLWITLSSSLRMWKLLEIIHFSSLRISKPGQKKSFSSH